MLANALRTQTTQNSGMAASRQMIPGLPNDIAMLCLLKVPRNYHACLASVCTAWRNAVRHPDFYRERRRLGISDAWLVLVSAEILSAPALLYSAYDLSTRQLLFKVRFPPSLPAEVHCGADLTLPGGATRFSVAQPTLPSAPFNYLDHYRIVAMNELFAVLGFSRRSRSHAPRCTFTIYNTVTDEWCQAAPLSVCREMFACGVIGNQLFVAGGVNVKGETERTTEVFDFSTGTWASAAALPAGVSKIQADAVFQGKLYVQSISDTGAEGRSRSCFWTYNPQIDTWQQLNEGGGLVGVQQLLANDKFLFAVGSHEELFRYDGKWTPIGGKELSRRTDAADNWRPAAAHCFHSSQRVFGHGDDIFFLNDGTHRAGLPSDGVTRCHHLFSVRPSCYQAGAVVSA